MFQDPPTSLPLRAAFSRDLAPNPVRAAEAPIARLSPTDKLSRAAWAQKPQTRPGLLTPRPPSARNVQMASFAFGKLVKQVLNSTE